LALFRLFYYKQMIIYKIVITYCKIANIYCEFDMDFIS